MESIVGRNRGAKSGYYSRRRKLSFREEKGTKLIKQLFVSVAIFLIALIIKNMDTPAMNTFKSRLAYILALDMDAKAVTASVEQFWASMNVTNDKLKSAFSSNILNSNSQNETTSMEDKIYDWQLLKDVQFEVPSQGKITSPFGLRVNPVTKKMEFHEGVDIDAKLGEDIKAVLDGEIVEARSSESWGNYIKIKHENDIYSFYAHASTLIAKEGQKVKKGEVIAKTGNTGLSEGPHLHFELKKGEKLVDPQNLINFEGKAEEG